MGLSASKNLICCTLFLLFFSLFANAQKTGEESLLLNGNWAFKTDPDNAGEKQNWFNPLLSVSGWDTMQVPSNWDLQNEYSHYVGKAWYRKSVTIPQSWKNKTVFLHFDGVYFDSKIWFNGKLLGGNNNGFLPFEFEVTDLINSGENTIVVCTDNFFRLGAVWNWGGIRRDVKLLATNQVRMVQQHIRPVINLENGTADIAVKVFMQNSGKQEQTVDGTVVLYRDGLLNKSLNFSAVIPANSRKEVVVKTSLRKNEVHLWHFDDPFLYNCTTTINAASIPVHQLSNRFGLRKIEVDHKNYTFKLNGEAVRLTGLNLVPDDRTTGNTLPLWRIKEDVDMMKELGCNMTRISHFPLPEEMYDYLDEKGMLIFPEVSLWGISDKVDPTHPVPKEWLNGLILNYYNHPSIIGWSVGNEIGNNPKVMDYVESATKLARSLDPTRLAVVVSHTANNSPDPIQYSDLGMVNKYGKNLGPITERMHQLHPDKLLFYSEYGDAQLTEDLNADFDAGKALDSIRNKPYLMGASIWTFNDYRSNYSGTKEFSENRAWGVVDVFRQKKKAWSSLRKEYAPIKNIRIENMNVKAKGISTAEIVLTPRTALDIPAFIMKGYRLVWSVKDTEGIIKHAGFEDLTAIKPGDKNISKLIKWPGVPHALSLQMELVSPLNYSVYDTTIFLQKPQAPEIVFVFGGRLQLKPSSEKNGMIRIVFQKNSSAIAYKLRYGKDKLTQETAPSVNHFIDITGLEIDKIYQVALVAINSAGESEPTEIREISTEYLLPPPVIQYTEPADGGFFIGYNTGELDYAFEVQYTSMSGDYSKAQSIRTSNKGVLFVPGLINGNVYHYRIRRVNQGLVTSLWSEEIAVTPDGNNRPVTPLIKKVIKRGPDAMILFVPVKKATGYEVRYKPESSSTWKSVMISSSQTHLFSIKGLKAGEDYDFKMAAINENGQSEFGKAIGSDSR